MATSERLNDYFLRHGIKGKLAFNKSVFVCMIPYEGISEKRIIGNKPASTKFLSISLLVLVAPGNFLVVFSGKL
jgi:hypothetical protein